MTIDYVVIFYSMARGHLYFNTNELQGCDIRTPMYDSSTPTVFKFLNNYKNGRQLNSTDIQFLKLADNRTPKILI